LRNQFTSAKVMMKHHESCVLLTQSVYPQTRTKHFAIPVTQMMLKINSLQNSRYMHVTISLCFSYISLHKQQWVHFKEKYHQQWCNSLPECPYLITFDLDLDLKQSIDGDVPGDHCVMVMNGPFSWEQ